MSAYIVSDATIDALVTFAIGGGVYRVTSENPQKVGQMLVNENYRSVNHRYREKELAHTYTFKPMTRHLSPVTILKLCDCYDYQACETEDYEATDAAKMIDGIRHRAIRTLSGYDDAPWGLHDEDRSNGVVLLSQIA